MCLMGAAQRRLAVTACLAVFLMALSVVYVGAEPAPTWSTDELVTFSEVVLTGRVVRVATGWDADTIYTYCPVQDGRGREPYSGRRNVRIASRKTSPKSAAFFAPTPYTSRS